MLTDPGPNDIFLYNTGQIKHLTDTTWNRKQFYRVTRVDALGGRTGLAEWLACPPCNVGANSIPNYASLTQQAIHTVGSSTFFAGQRADGFYVDLGSIFDLGELRPFHPDFLLKGAATAGINSLASLNVHSIAIQVPITQLTRGWSTPSSYTAAELDDRRVDDGEPPEVAPLRPPGEDAGPWMQVSRLGNPLINEVIIPMGQKDYWNTQWPAATASSRRTTTTPRWRHC